MGIVEEMESWVSHNTYYLITRWSRSLRCVVFYTVKGGWTPSIFKAAKYTDRLVAFRVRKERGLLRKTKVTCHTFKSAQEERVIGYGNSKSYCNPWR